MGRERYVTWLVAAGLLAALAGAWLANTMRAPSTPVLQSGTWLPLPRALPDMQLLDQTGATVGAARLQGHPSLVFFGFTNCPDVCPTTLTMLTRAQTQVSIPGLEVVLVTVDPERDTPRQLAQYLQAFHGPAAQGPMLGLTGDQPELDHLMRTLGVAAARTDMPGGNYMIDHSATVFLLNSAGENVAIFSPPFERDSLVNDLRALSARLGS
ncbi:MAG TPA: SCO family protein [Steroidobacteraceae bacterium]|nr:SCO family protein [Steroidobacteraceae bacterium]HRX89490.1 SCO family protein [Steroidobacteraceae bacterium]